MNRLNPSLRLPHFAFLVTSLSAATLSYATHANASTGTQALKAIIGECFNSELSSFNADTPLSLNGVHLNSAEKQNIHWIKHCVLPFLPGTPEGRAKIVAQTTWWSLREGVLELPGMKGFRYSLCHENRRDRTRSTAPLYNCPTSIWQVGLAAGQVANYSEAVIENATYAAIGELSPQIKPKDLLTWTAALAGYPSGSETNDEITNSSGRVQRSWFVRNPLVGFQIVQKGEVVPECVNASKGWCFGSSYDEERKFARNRATMNRVVSDLLHYYLAN